MQRRIRVAIAVGEAEYGRRLAKVLMGHYKNLLEIHMYLEDFAGAGHLCGRKSDNLDLDIDVLICADLDKERIQELRLECLEETVKVVVLEEGEEDQNEEIEEVLKGLLGEDRLQFESKYQNVSHLMELIQKIAGDQEKPIVVTGNRQLGGEILGVYSLADNQYQLPFAMTLGSILGENENRHVLLLDLQENSGLNKLLETKGELNLENLLANCEEEYLSRAELLSSIGHKGKLSIVNPVDNSECLSEVNAKQYEEILKIMERECGYDTFIINFGTRFLGFSEAVSWCKNLYLLKGKDQVSSLRENEFLEELDKKGYEKVIDHIEPVEIPYSVAMNSCERLVEEWKWGEIGDTIRYLNAAQI